MKSSPEKVKRIVIKIGTNLLTGKKAFDGHVLEEMVKEVCELKRDHGTDIVIVSSGAVGCGMMMLGLTKRPVSLPEKQAVAAVGQARLMHYYETLFQTYGDGLTTAQVLLTQADLDSRQNYLNVRNTLNTLFAIGTVIPVINENDSTATEELKFGDNDTLAAKIAAKINAGLLILLTDVEGLYDKNPAEDQSARLICDVERITPDLEAAAGGAGSIAATGGMRTKIDAAKIATAAGVDCVITSGHQRRVIHRVLSGEAVRTRFFPAKVALTHRKRWIAFGRATSGAIHVDNGARNAIVNQGKSLLPAGITAVEGRFNAGASVRVMDASGALIARGLVNYDSEALRAIQGKKSGTVAAILGRKDFDEAIHRNNMVVLQ
ncbi:MAG: glutamate 5-kinase [Candidatus Hydrogenedentes bacterium]|nr:glutamate 5-kinase [Candidatus Hydrogenedentota bacterium]